MNSSTQLLQALCGKLSSADGHDWQERLWGLLGGQDLPDLNLEVVYSLMGMRPQFQRAKKRLPKRPDRWIVPVIEGATCAAVINAIECTGVEVAVLLEYDDLDGPVWVDDRHPDAGLYLRTLERQVHPEPSGYESWDSGNTLLEELLVVAGIVATSGLRPSSNERGVTTVCSATRSGRIVPCLYLDSSWEVLYIQEFEPNGELYGTRKSIE